MWSYMYTLTASKTLMIYSESMISLDFKSYPQMMGVNMTKRFYIDVEVPPFNGKLSIDIDAGSEKQAWENVHRMLERRVYQLKTTHTINLPWKRETSDD